ncbi:MAG: DUF6788 family protein [bacterium]
MKHAKGVSSADKAARSRLHQLLERADGLAHGSLIRMARRCGNPRCRCATEDKKHESWYLGVTEKRKTRMKHLPKGMEAKVRRWLDQYKLARQLLDQMSQEAWKQLDRNEP